MRVLLISAISLVLCGCAHGPLTAPNLASAVSANTHVKKNIGQAQADVNTVLKDNAVLARPDLVLALRDADTQLAMANQTVNDQAQDLDTKQKQIDDVTAQGNKAIADKAAMEPKHKRDIQALVGAWIICSMACILGPLVLKAYPALLLIPTSLESLVCSFAAFIICSGIASLLILFGVL